MNTIEVVGQKIALDHGAMRKVIDMLMELYGSAKVSEISKHINRLNGGDAEMGELIKLIDLFCKCFDVERDLLVGGGVASIVEARNVVLVAMMQIIAGEKTSESIEAVESDSKKKLK